MAFLFLSIVATVARLGFDGLRELSYQMKLRPLNPLTSSLPSDEIVRWDSLIADLKNPK
jgi:hypothetical protein